MSMWHPSQVSLCATWQSGLQKMLSLVVLGAGNMVAGKMENPSRSSSPQSLPQGSICGKEGVHQPKLTNAALIASQLATGL